MSDYGCDSLHISKSVIPFTVNISERFDLLVFGVSTKQTSPYTEEGKQKMKKKNMPPISPPSQKKKNPWFMLPICLNEIIFEKDV